MSHHNTLSLRYAILVPLALMLAAIVSCCHSYSYAKQILTADLNEAMHALASENRELWTRQDTIAALRMMHETTRKPIIYQASDANFRYPLLKDEAYFTIALVDKKGVMSKTRENRAYNRLTSDSIIIVPERAADGLAIQIQGFADCSVASVLSASDQTLPGLLFILSILSMSSMVIWLRTADTPHIIQETAHSETKVNSTIYAAHPLKGIKLTPMQRQFAQILLDAPDMRVDKGTLCSMLWGNKINAEESLYTLVRRTKTAFASTGIEIICNRGESYELRIKS